MATTQVLLVHRKPFPAIRATIFAQRSAGTLGTILTVMLVASAADMAIARYLT